MSNLDDIFSQLNQTKPKSIVQDSVENTVSKKESETKVEVKKEVKKRKRKDAKQNDNDILPPMLKAVPSRRRVHCGICKRMLNSNEQGWFLQVDDLEYWWCRKCSKD